MKTLLWLLILVGSISSCSEKHDCTPASTQLTLLPTRQIILQPQPEGLIPVTIFRVENGKNILVEYTHTRANCENVSDDEYCEKLRFEIDESLTAFEYKDEAIGQTKCFYQAIGAWTRGDQYAINKGIIKGRKVSSREWDIEIKVVTEPLFPNEKPIPVAVKGRFKE